MTAPQNLSIEDDARFPTGPWVGFFLQPNMPGRHSMELHLTFRQGRAEGEGRDRIGPFRIRGRYEVQDGTCWWTKTYLGRHDVHYKGYNEGKGIWGLWEIGQLWKGGFHIWPETMADPTQPRQSVAEDLPRMLEPQEVEPEDALITVSG